MIIMFKPLMTAVRWDSGYNTGHFHRELLYTPLALIVMGAVDLKDSDIVRN